MLGMYGPMMYGSMNMMSSMTTGNAPRYFQQRYGCGHEDFGTGPYPLNYPTAVTPFTPYNGNHSWLSKLFKKLFN